MTKSRILFAFTLLLALPVALPVFAASPTNQFADRSGTSLDGNSGNVVLPTNIASGDLLTIIIVSRQSATITTSDTDWTASAASGGSATTIRAFYKDADGTESGANVAFTLTGAGDWSYVAFRITGAETVANQVPFSATAFIDVDNGSVDAPNLAPGVGSQDFLWIAAGGGRDSGAFATAYDANYSNTGFSRDASQNATVNYMDRQLTASSENPGAITLDTAADWSAITIAIPPAGFSGGGGGSVVPIIHQQMRD